MTLWDIGVLKVSAALFGIVVGAYFAPFVLRNVWWFVVPLVVLGGRSGYRWFTAEGPGSRVAGKVSWTIRFSAGSSRACH
jgi:hypothetical protein